MKKTPSDDKDLSEILSRVYEIKEVHAYRKIREVAEGFGDERGKNLSGLSSAWPKVLDAAKNIGGDQHWLCEQMEEVLKELEELRKFKRTVRCWKRATMSR